MIVLISTNPILLEVIPWCCYPVDKEVVLNRAVTASLEVVELVCLPQFGLR